jgi:hypothetical protein
VKASLLVGLVVVAGAATASASPLSDALARHGPPDIATLRAQLADPAARCTLGAIYAQRNDLPRAALYLTGCDRAPLPDDIARAVVTASRDVKRRLDASRYAALDIVSRPDGLTAQIDDLPGESFLTPAVVWIAPGTHQVRASLGERSWTQRVTTEAHKNALVVIETGLGAPPPPARPTEVDFADEPGGTLGEQHTAPPPDIQHPSLIRGKYAGVAEPAPDAPIADPLATPAASTDEHNLWLGARLGGGIFDDGGTAARPGVSVAVAARYRLTHAFFATARADWSRRGGDVMTGPNEPNAAIAPIDALGACGGLGTTLLGAASPRSHLALAVLAQLRADVRLADVRGAAPVRRTGLGVAIGAELALPSTPLSVGLRVEQGLTDLVAGSRDRAILAEIGIDVR